jgi:hypothetical protein
MRRTALVAAALLVAAAASAQEPAPSTVLDPPAYAPEPEREPRCASPLVGGAVGVCRQGRGDEARRIVRRFLEALLARDVGTLESLTSDPVVRYEGGLTWPRGDLLNALLRATDARGLARTSDVAAYVDLARARVAPARLLPGSRLRPGDQVVLADLRVRPAAQSAMATLVFEHANAVRFIVRLPPDGRVVGM